MKLIYYILNMIILFYGISWAGSTASFQWDANIEENLSGYTIYWGTKSRLIESMELINNYCETHEPNNESCVDEWLNICKNESDRACHKALFEYDNYFQIDKEKTNHTISGLTDGDWYFALDAFDEHGNYSAFAANEIHIKIDTIPPGIPQNFRKKNGVQRPQ